MTVESSSGENRAEPLDRSPLRRMVRLKSPPLVKSADFMCFTDSSESSSSMTGDTAETVVVHPVDKSGVMKMGVGSGKVANGKGGDFKLSVAKGGEDKRGEVGVVCANEGAKKMSGSPNMGKPNVNKCDNREVAKGALLVEVGAMSHVAAVKSIIRELSGLIFGGKNFDVGTTKGQMMTVITDNAHLRGPNHVPPIVWVRGLPGGFRVFLYLRVDAVIVVKEPNYDCVIVDSSQFCVCVSIWYLVEYLLLAFIVNLMSP